MTDDILSLALAALEDDKKATPGPWEEHDDRRKYVRMNFSDERVLADRDANAQFCAAARTREPALAREVIRLSEELRAALTCNENAKTYIEKLDFKAERDALRAELERMTPLAGTSAAELRDEVLRLRPVVNAAKAWLMADRAADACDESKVAERRDLFLLWEQADATLRAAIDAAAAKEAK